jgi:hypothetical protein
MKIRDLVVIIFTAIVALLVLGRAARADGACPTAGEGGGCQASTSESEGDLLRGFPGPLVDWLCSDSCALLCRHRCLVACEDSKDPDCVVTCFPVCDEACYDACTGPDDAPEPIEYVDDRILLLRDLDAGAPSPP